MKPLAEKYSRRKGPRRGSFIVVVSTLGVALENTRLVVRELRVVNRRRQLRHIESSPSSLIRDGVVRRIIAVVEGEIGEPQKALDALEVLLRLPSGEDSADPQA